MGEFTPLREDISELRSAMNKVAHPSNSKTSEWLEKVARMLIFNTYRKYVMDIPGLLAIMQIIITSLCGILWYMFRGVKDKSDKNSEDLLIYKTYIAETFVTQTQLAKALETLSQNIQVVLQAVNRIEDRMYRKEQE